MMYGRKPEFTRENKQPTQLTISSGTVVAVAGDDFAVIGSDTRLSEGYSILSRDVSKVRTVTKDCLLGSVGFHGDVLTLTKVQFNCVLIVFEVSHQRLFPTTSRLQLPAWKWAESWLMV